MNKIVMSVMALGALSFTAGAGKPGAAETIPTIREIMQQSHRCQNNYIYLVRRELQRDNPDWYVLENRSDDLVRMGGLLAKNTPPRGSKESWAHFTSVYVAHATLLNDAAQRQDKTTALTHQTKLSSMCA